MITHNKNILQICGMSFIGLILFSSCKKDASVIAPDPFYEISVEGFTVTFTNQTKDAVSYKWDFGDGATSTDENPIHTYTAKGKFVPTLYATNSNGTTREASTVLHISKGSPVKLNDNTLSDWDTVATNVVQGGPDAGNFIKAKYDYDGNNVYVYFEQHTKKADGSIYDLYIDADNNPATGLLTGDIPNGAYEVLFEGTIFDGWLDSYYHTGDQANFGGYALVGLSEFYTLGTYQESGGVLKFEFALKRSKIKGLTGNGMKIGVQVFSADFAALVGYSPDLGSDAFFLDMSE
jgi:PKD repeat protein